MRLECVNAVCRWLYLKYVATTLSYKDAHKLLKLNIPTCAATHAKYPNLILGDIAWVSIK